VWLWNLQYSSLPPVAYLRLLAHDDVFSRTPGTTSLPIRGRSNRSAVIIDDVCVGGGLRSVVVRLSKRNGRRTRRSSSREAGRYGEDSRGRAESSLARSDLSCKNRQFRTRSRLVGEVERTLGFVKEGKAGTSVASVQVPR
jgi:hypothetical protein